MEVGHHTSKRRRIVKSNDVVQGSDTRIGGSSSLGPLLTDDEGCIASPLILPEAERSRGGNSSLCATCQQLLQDIHRMPLNSPVSLNDSRPWSDRSPFGCYICSILRATLHRSHPELPCQSFIGSSRSLSHWTRILYDADDDGSEYTYPANPDYLIRFSVRIVDAETKREQACRKFGLFHSSLLAGTITPVFSFSTSSEQSLKKAASWIKECTECHDPHGICQNRRPTQAKSMYPLRLLDLRQRAEGWIRMCQSKDHRVRYATLSHRWGVNQKKHDFCLLRSNLDQYRRMINLGSLPLTYRDAIDIAGRLGYQYLWIDSLCIVQDDQEDWHSEALRMDQIYANCELNIAAAHSRDNGDGIFRERSVSATNPPYVDLDGRCYRVADTECWDKDVEHCPLNARGWVFQERVLSPRNLYFTGTQIAWECSATRKMETCSEPQRIRLRKKLPPVKFSLLHTASMPIEGLLHLWTQLVGSYSKGALSFSSDRLIAIAGIAKRLAEEMRCDYLAGMWRTSLEHQLLWRFHVGDARELKSKASHAGRVPSWSWASVDGPVDWMTVFSRTDRLVASIISAEVEDLPGTGYTANLQGCLQVRGVLKPLTTHLDLLCSMFPSGPETDAWGGDVQNCVRTINGVEVRTFPFDRSLYLDSIIAKDSDLCCMPIRYSHEGRFHVIQGIVLSLTQTPNTYIREGIFHIRFDATFHVVNKYARLFEFEKLEQHRTITII